MTKNNTHTNLLNAVKEKLAPGTNITTKLMDILNLGREAVYRRLRSEVYFSLDEAAAISTALGISMDNIIGCNDPKSRSLQLKLTSYINPSASDYRQMDEYISFLENLVSVGDTEIGTAANMIPLSLLYRFGYLTRFMILKWSFQAQISNTIKSFSDILLTERFNKLCDENTRLAEQMENTYYIWDFLIFQYLANDIKYFAGLRLITPDDIKLIKKDLLDALDYFEQTAIRGQFSTGKPVQFYISNINIDSSYTYFYSRNANMSLGLISTFSLNTVSSLNDITTQHIQKWILSQKRVSTLISQSGEMQRIHFFKRQREIIKAI